VNLESLHTLLRKLRKQLIAARIARFCIILLFVCAVIWAAGLSEPNSRRTVFLIAAAAVMTWILMIINSARSAREIQTGSILMGTGQLDDAEVWFRRAIEQFSLSMQTKFVACQQLASLFLKREAYQETVAVCREILRYRMGRLQNVWINTRIMLADSLLYLDRVNEAYEAMRPIYNMPLSLANRMRLLPIQLRYELTADHAQSAIQSLQDKVKIAELLDSRQAALVHALLAEACRRENQLAQCEFLLERARLYYDLQELTERYPMLVTVTGKE